MAILGLILFAAAVGAGFEIALSNRAAIDAEAFGYTVTSASPMAFLLVGALIALVATLGLLLITGTWERRRQRHLNAKHRVRETVDTNEALVEENERLRAALDAERKMRATLGGVAVPPGVGDAPYADQVTDAVRAETMPVEPYPDEPRRAARVDTGVDASTENGLGRRRRSSTDVR